MQLQCAVRSPLPPLRPGLTAAAAHPCCLVSAAARPQLCAVWRCCGWAGGGCVLPAEGEQLQTCWVVVAKSVAKCLEWQADVGARLDCPARAVPMPSQRSAVLSAQLSSSLAPRTRAGRLCPESPLLCVAHGFCRASASTSQGWTFGDMLYATRRGLKEGLAQVSTGGHVLGKMLPSWLLKCWSARLHAVASRRAWLKCPQVGVCACFFAAGCFSACCAWCSSSVVLPS